MQGGGSSVQSLVLLARQHQNNPDLLIRDITEKQVRALQTRISNMGLPFTRGTRLECLRTILGYSKPVLSTNDLTMADAMGILDMDNRDFTSLFVWAMVELTTYGVQI